MGENLLATNIRQAGRVVIDSARETGLWEFAATDFVPRAYKSEHNEAQGRNLAAMTISELGKAGKDLLDGAPRDLVPTHISTSGFREAVYRLCTNTQELNPGELALGLIHATRLGEVQKLLESDKQLAFLVPIALASLAERYPDQVLPVIDRTVRDNSLGGLIPLSGDSPSIGGVVTLLHTAERIAQEQLGSELFSAKEALREGEQFRRLLGHQAVTDLLSYNWTERRIAMKGAELVRQAEEGKAREELDREVTSNRVYAAIRSIGVTSFGFGVPWSLTTGGLMASGLPPAVAAVLGLGAGCAGYLLARAQARHKSRNAIRDRREEIAREI